MTNPPPPGAVDSDAYVPWVTRLLSWIIDGIVPVVISSIATGIFLSISAQRVTECITYDESELDLGEYCVSGNQGATPLAWIVLLLGYLIALGFLIWNNGMRQGTTGSSIGNTIMKFTIVSEETGQPLGVGGSVGRLFAHLIDSICYVGFLFPLWDPKRQTIADKLLKTVALPR